ncbi:flagellar protein FlaG [bacterium]|nr:flagellar protein FlaG [bacterium]
MRIEGAIVAANAVSHLGNTPVDQQAQRDRAQAGNLPLAAQQSAEQGDDARPVGKHMLAQAVGQVEQLMATVNESLRFKVHEDTNRTIITVVNQDTGEVLREIPSEKFLDLVAMFQKQLSGLLVDENR